ncbi:MAG: hypothetical protein JXR51_06105 [Bacteroidales bacterium]|nr:hypothetical protein [Bacteroidales bacterium]
MKQFIIISIFILSLFTSCKTQKQTTQNPQKELKYAITYAINLLENQNYEMFLSKFIEPDQFGKTIEESKLKEFAEMFKIKKAEQLLNVLKSIKNSEPEYNTDNSEATFNVDKEIASKNKIIFKKLENLWYIAN